MLLRVNNLLLPSDIASLREQIASAEFVDGSVSGKPALKNNLQSLQGNPGLEQASDKIIRSLMNRQEFKIYAMPKHVSLVFNRYDEGMDYKDHMDSAIMGGPRREPFRADLSLTLFLSEPVDYEGGELVIQSPLGEVRIKEAAGTAIVYPSTMIHRVEVITKGIRWAAIGWIQSMLREGPQRELLFELEQLRHDLVRDYPDSPYQVRVDRIKENLLRFWTEL